MHEHHAFEDAAQVVLPVLKDQVARCVHGATPGVVVLTQRAVVGLMRVCARLLAYRPDVTDDLIDCIKVPCRAPHASCAVAMLCRIL